MKLPLSELRQRALNIFTSRGLPHSKASELLDMLIESHLLGYPSHGLGRIPMYANELEEGNIDGKAQADIAKESPCTAVIDGNWSMGPLVIKRGLELAMQKAKQLGVAVITFRRTPDIARLGSYVKLAADQGYIAQLFVNDAGGSSAMCPPGTTTPFFSTNPMAAGIPTGKGFPIVIDMSTSAVAIGKLRQSISFGKSIPEGWLIERDGTPCTEARHFFKIEDSAALLPLGGMLSGHKGYALSLLVDIMAGALSGSGTSGQNKRGREQNGATLIVINPMFFCDEDDFQKEVDQLIDRLKSLPALSTGQAVRIPGERLADLDLAPHQIIEIDPETWIKFLALEA